MDNFVRVECDFSAYGLWTRSGAAITPEAFELSPALCVALRAWQAHYEESVWQLGLEKPRFDYSLHEAIAREIADLVRAERPGLHVVFQGYEPYPGEQCSG